MGRRDKGVVGALAPVVSVSREFKMVQDCAHVMCPSFSKVSHSYFLGSLLNKSGHPARSARKVRPLFEIAKHLAVRILRVKCAKIVRDLAKWS